MTHWLKLSAQPRWGAFGRELVAVNEPRGPNLRGGTGPWSNPSLSNLCHG